MGAMARAYFYDRREARPSGLAAWTLPAIFWTALAAGILIKGPLILMFVVLAVGMLLVMDRSARWLLTLRPLPGIIWMLALVLPWFLAIVSRSGDSFFANSIGDDMLAKVASSQEAHGAPPGYYLAAVLGDVLAGRDARGHGRAEPVGGPAREGRALPDRLDHAVLDRVRTGR